jgi:hypothetical protein
MNLQPGSDRSVAGDPPAGPGERLEPERQRLLLEDGLAYLTDALAVGAPERLSDPGNVQHGAEGARLNLEFNTGLAGVVGSLLRLCHGGPRWWMVDRPAGPGAVQLGSGPGWGGRSRTPAGGR